MFYPVALHIVIQMRGKPLRIACWVLLGVIVTGSSGQARAQTSPAIDSTSTLTGVYTEEQAKRGKEVYLSLCRSCHIPSTGDSFARRWAGKTLLDLFSYIYTTMPDNNPRSVDEASNADIIGYLMQATGMPVGTHDVPVSADSLKAIRIEVKKQSPPTATLRRRAVSASSPGSPASTFAPHLPSSR
jgi:S-disulfanyl-L-cysteine oxidoreductase SoxD